MTPRAFIGIDPGKQGGIAFIPVDVRLDVSVWDTPVINGKRVAYDEQGMAALLHNLLATWDLKVALEDCHSRPGQSAVATFSQGEGFGLWRGLLAMAGIPFSLVTPQRWKGVVLDGTTKDKQAAFVVGARLYPSISDQLHGPRGGLYDGRCDALCIAEWKRRQG